MPKNLQLNILSGNLIFWSESSNSWHFVHLVGGPSPSSVKDLPQFLHRIIWVTSQNLSKTTDINISQTYVVRQT